MDYWTAEWPLPKSKEQQIYVDGAKVLIGFIQFYLWG